MNPKRHSGSFSDYGNVYGAFSANGFMFLQFVRVCPEFHLDCGDTSPLSKRGHVRALQTFNLQPSTNKNADAATLYENLLTIQNAADLEWPATDPANAGVRDEFLLGIFPPDHGGNHASPPAPPQPTPSAK
jgi:hypothetical protein